MVFSVSYRNSSGQKEKHRGEALCFHIVKPVRSRKIPYEWPELLLSDPFWE